MQEAGKGAKTEGLCEGWGEMWPSLMPGLFGEHGRHSRAERVASWPASLMSSLCSLRQGFGATSCGDGLKAFDEIIDGMQ